MGFVMEISGPKGLKKIVHKLFQCPTFWKSVWNNFWKDRPYIRCPSCQKPIHCYWDGNDNSQGIDYCNKCDKKIRENESN
jgi:hypothetical protein